MTTPIREASMQKVREALETISAEGWYAHSNNSAQLVDILDEHKRAADEALAHLGVIENASDIALPISVKPPTTKRIDNNGLGISEGVNPPTSENAPDGSAQVQNKCDAEPMDQELASGAIARIHALLDDGGIPRGTYADDHVRNLVALYNQRGDKIAELEAILRAHAEAAVLAARGSYDVPGFDACVKAEVERRRDHQPVPPPYYSEDDITNCIGSWKNLPYFSHSNGIAQQALVHLGALRRIAYISNEVGNDSEQACEMGQIAIEALGAHQSTGE